MPHLLFMDILLSLHPSVCTLRLTVVTSRVRCLLAINHFQWCTHRREDTHRGLGRGDTGRNARKPARGIRRCTVMRHTLV